MMWGEAAKKAACGHGLSVKVWRALKGFGMAEIADGIGRFVCNVIGALMPQCRTGQSVANIGYGLVALILLFLGVSRFIKRAGG